MVRQSENLTDKQEFLIPVSLGLIGYGIVGQAVAYGFQKASLGKDKISYYDKYKKSLPLKNVVKVSEFIFITLPTPMKKDESGIDLSIIEENIAQIVPLTNNTNKIIIIKSTIGLRSLLRWKGIIKRRGLGKLLLGNVFNQFYFIFIGTGKIHRNKI